MFSSSESSDGEDPYQPVDLNESFYLRGVEKLTSNLLSQKCFVDEYTIQELSTNEDEKRDETIIDDGENIIDLIQPEAEETSQPGCSKSI